MTSGVAQPPKVRMWMTGDNRPIGVNGEPAERPDDEAARRAVRAKDWSAVPAGEEMDAALRLDFRGLARKGRASRDWRTAMAYAIDMIVMEQSGGIHVACEPREGKDHWRVTLDGTGYGGAVWESEASGETLALAFCRAMLQFQQDDDA